MLDHFDNAGLDVQDSTTVGLRTLREDHDWPPPLVVQEPCFLLELLDAVVDVGLVFLNDLREHQAEGAPHGLKRAHNP